MDTTGTIPISNYQLAFTVLLVLITGTISAVLKLGLLRSLIWGTVRTFVQLTLVGYALTYIFNINNIWLIITVITIMCYAASRTAVKRTPNVPNYPYLLAFASLAASTYLVGSIVVGLIISPEPWYSARIVIPIFGMLLGNSMNGIALSLDRLYGEVRARAHEIEAMLSFGATPWEAIRPSVREAIRAGMTPTINSLMVVGLVSLPGMMTGQILGGANPQEAVRYQIVVMLMITSAVAIGCLILVGLSYKNFFNEDGALKTSVIQRDKKN
ncbi:MAG: iron export ABC transporter permease subunit FetB [Desulfotomaculum sp.]|nr:iron export ABC transporter permease subunit FetB [Desulfotomaculum sp.]